MTLTKITIKKLVLVVLACAMTSVSMADGNVGFVKVFSQYVKQGQPDGCK